MDWSPRIAVRGRPRGWHRPMAMGMGYPSAPFVALAPAITVLAPSTGAVGTACTITGLYFGATQGMSFVTVNGLVATVDSWSNTSIQIHIPVGATTGSVIVTVGGLSSNGLTFTVTGGQVYNYLVQPGASDSGNTGPFGTIAYAMQVATAALTGTGKVIGVRGATYDQSIINPTNVSGTSWTNRIMVQNYNGESVTLRPASGTTCVLFNSGNHAYLEFDGINLDGRGMASYSGCFGAHGSIVTGVDNHHIRVRNAECIGNDNLHAFGCLFTGPTVQVGNEAASMQFNKGIEFYNLVVHGGGMASGGDHAFYLAGSEIIVDGCDISDYPAAGIQLYQNSGPNLQTGCRLSNNRIHHPRSVTASHWGIITGVSNSLFYNNVIFDIGLNGGESAGIKAYHTVSSGFYFNTIYGAVTRGFDGADSSGCTIQNNIFYGNGTNYTPSSNVNTENHNSRDGTNPNFADLPGRNFHLSALTASSITRGGTPISGISQDTEQDPRHLTAPSLGAYEYP